MVIESLVSVYSTEHLLSLVLLNELESGFTLFAKAKLIFREKIQFYV